MPEIVQKAFHLISFHAVSRPSVGSPVQSVGPVRRFPVRLLTSLVMLALVTFSSFIPVALADERRSEKSDKSVDVKELSIAGYVENVTIYPENLTFESRMDTGATTSSLNALNQKRFERDGKEWIRFDVVDPDNDKKKITLEREIVRNVRIIRHDGNHQRRPVVKMGFCIGDKYREGDVSLQDRSELTYQLLVGRNHMKNSVLVDSGHKHLLDPRCQRP